MYTLSQKNPEVIVEGIVGHIHYFSQHKERENIKYQKRQKHKALGIHTDYKRQLPTTKIPISQPEHPTF